MTMVNAGANAAVTIGKISPPTPPSDRDRYLAVLFNGPLVRADAAVVLAGEDAAPRLSTAISLFRAGGAGVLILAGGKEEPPRILSADSLAAQAIDAGLDPGRMMVEHGSQNTHEQAVNVLDLCALNEWRNVCVIASAYHLPRAILTFVAELTTRNELATVRLIPLPAAPCAWWAKPEGCPRTRLELLALDLEKIGPCCDRGHAASYADGLAYFQRWEP